MILAFLEDFIFTEFRENKTLVNISKFTVIAKISEFTVIFANSLNPEHLYLIVCTFRVLIIFANSLNPEQARHVVGPVLDSKCLTLSVFLKFVNENVHLEKNQKTFKKHAKLSNIIIIINKLKNVCHTKSFFSFYISFVFKGQNHVFKTYTSSQKCS